MPKKTVVIRVSEKARKRLKIKATQNGMSLIDFVEELSRQL